MNEDVFDFENLKVYQKSLEYVDFVYEITKDFPKEEIFSLTNQFRRASVSICLNACPVKQLEIKMYYIYVLQSMKDMNFYTGFAKNLKLRFKQHNKGLVESTKSRRPFNLIYYEACLDQNDATKREKYLKSFHGKAYLKRRL